MVNMNSSCKEEKDAYLKQVSAGFIFLQEILVSGREEEGQAKRIFPVLIVTDVLVNKKDQFTVSSMVGELLL